MNKISIFILALITIYSCYQTESEVDSKSFPRLKFDQVKLLSVSPSIYDRDINFYQDNKLMYSTENGLYFVDSNTHRPITINYIEKILDRAAIDSLKSILTSTPEVGSDYSKACLPIFRDAVVFYNQDMPVAHIDICFTCDETEFFPAVDYMNYFDASGRVNKLRQLFLQNGVRVSRPPPITEAPSPKDSSRE
jgi:hypothetical protein